ncbi:unnamed protein product, partial [Polarella glacialis]
MGSASAFAAATIAVARPSGSWGHLRRRPPPCAAAMGAVQWVLEAERRQASSSSSSSASGGSFSTSGLSWAPGASSPKPWRRPPSTTGAGGSEPAKVPPRTVLRVSQDEISYSVVIESCSRRGDFERAAAWLQEMVASTVKPNVFTFNAVIAAFAGRGKATEAIKWFDKMRAQGLEPNVVSYSAVINACAKVGDSVGAV